jgi:hypothetical protein
MAAAAAFADASAKIRMLTSCSGNGGVRARQPDSRRPRPGFEGGVGR